MKNKFKKYEQDIVFILSEGYDKGLNSTSACFYYLEILGCVKSCWCYTSRPEPLQQFPEGTATNLHSNQQPHQP